MNPLRTVIFIDGRNFKHSLGAFQFHGIKDPIPGRRYKLDEKHFLWREFFLGIIRKFNERTGWEHRLIRVYWYNAASIRPFATNERLIEKVLNDYRAEIPDLTMDIIKELGEAWHGEQRKHFEHTREVVLEGIQRNVDFLEFKYVGEFVVNPFQPYKFAREADGSLSYKGTWVGEKGVDIGIAVDMLAKMQLYDAAVLVSGDADFLPVVRHIKDHLRAVYQFSLAQGIPPRITYLTRWLVGCVDTFESYDELELLETYLDRRSGIPQRVLEAIDERIVQLKGLSRPVPPR